MRVSSIGEYIKEQREQAKISLRQLAAAAGVSNPYLSQIERGLRRPSAEILQQIAKGLRISAEALYVQAGILEDRPADSGVRAAVLAEPELTERQKQVLLEIYDSFRKEAAAARAGATEPAADAAGVLADAGSPASAAGPSGPADRPTDQDGAARGPALDDEDDDDPLAVAEPLGATDAAPHEPVPAPGSASQPGPAGAGRAGPEVHGRPGQAGQEG
jgi:transcriptional regulator with XRE-family HTH domain